MRPPKGNVLKAELSRLFEIPSRLLKVTNSRYSLRVEVLDCAYPLEPIERHLKRYEDITKCPVTDDYVGNFFAVHVRYGNKATIPNDLIDEITELVCSRWNLSDWDIGQNGQAVRELLTRLPHHQESQVSFALIRCAQVLLLAKRQQQTEVKNAV